MKEYCLFCKLSFGSAERRIQWGGHDVHEGCFNDHLRKALNGGNNHVAQDRPKVQCLSETGAGVGNRF